MSLIDPVVMEFEHEAGTTRRMLEVVPEAEFNWAPHTKSMTLGKLVAHIAEIPNWADVIVKETGMDMGKGGKGEYKPNYFEKRADLLAFHDKNVKAASAVMSSLQDKDAFTLWTFKFEGRVIFTLPRMAVLRSMILNHIVHHRGQLSVFLRLKNVALPSVYGPTADVPM